MEKDYIFFLSYIKKTITYKALKVKTKYKKLYDSEKLILNQPNDNEEEKINLIVDTGNDIEDFSFTIDFNDLSDVFSNKKIVDSFNALTVKQKQILYELYVNNMTEREVAQKLNSSFQNINKIKKAALKNINKSLIASKYRN